MANIFFASRALKSVINPRVGAKTEDV